MSLLRATKVQGLLRIPRYHRIAIIYNPLAGGLRGSRSLRLRVAEEMLRRAGHEVLSTATSGPRTAGAIAARCVAEGADLVLAVGGDGTINEVVEGMVHRPVPLGILPAGTANVLAHEMAIGSRMSAVVAGISECVARRISLGRLENENGDVRYFLLMAGAGFDARIIGRLDVGLKRRLGKFAYWIGGLSQLGQPLEELEVRVGGRIRSCTFALVSRVRNYGGDFEIARDVSLLDDEFEVVLLEGDSYRYLNYLYGISANALFRMPGVSRFHTRQVELRPTNGHSVFVQTDGEMAGALPAKITLEKNALTLLMPKRYAGIPEDSPAPRRRLGQTARQLLSR